MGGPGAVARRADRLDIFVRGADDQLWQKAWNGGWMGYYPLGGLLTSSPAVASGMEEVRGSSPLSSTHYFPWSGTVAS